MNDVCEIFGWLSFSCDQLWAEKDTWVDSLRYDFGCRDTKCLLAVLTKESHRELVVAVAGQSVWIV